MDKDLIYRISRADRQLDAPTAAEAATIVELGSVESEVGFLGDPLTNADKIQAVQPRVFRVDTISFDDSTINGIDGGAAASVLTIVGSRATVILTAGVEFDADATITEVVQAVDVAAGAADAGFDASLNGNALVITHEADGNGVASPTFTDTAVTTIATTTDGVDPILKYPTPGELTKIGLEAGIVNTSQVLVNTANSATNTGLTIDSPGRRCTGTGLQTYTMPVAADVPFIGWGLPFYNHSTGDVTIKSSGGNKIQDIAPGAMAFVKCILLSGTDASSWEVEYSFPTVREITDATDTITQADSGKIIKANRATAQTFTVTGPISAGFNCIIVQVGAGAVTFDDGGGATVTNRQSFTDTAGTDAVASLVCHTADAIVLAGDLA